MDLSKTNLSEAICFWCGKEKGQLMPQSRNADGEVSNQAIFGYEPCQECQNDFDKIIKDGGLIVIEYTDKPKDRNQLPLFPDAKQKFYPTGEIIGVDRELAIVAFGDTVFQQCPNGIVGADQELFNMIVGSKCDE